MIVFDDLSMFYAVPVMNVSAQAMFADDTSADYCQMIASYTSVSLATKACNYNRSPRPRSSSNCSGAAFAHDVQEHAVFDVDELLPDNGRGRSNDRKCDNVHTEGDA